MSRIYTKDLKKKKGVDGNKMEKRNPFINDKLARISQAAVELLGYPDRMLYPSKSMKKPTTIFNANIYNSRAEKIWFGDLEIERDREALIKLSNRIGPIYVLWEMDGRFLEKAPTAAYVMNQAIVTVESGNITYSPEFRERVDILKTRHMKKPLTAKKKKNK